MQHSSKWSHLRRVRLLLAALSAVGVSASTNANPPLSYTMTFYVDEGRHSISGHVFVELSDGKNRLFRGFYPKEARTDVFGKIIAPAGVGGGEVRDDVHHRWDVRKSFPITGEGFRRAVEAAERSRSKTWCLLNHCGDFALGIAEAAGLRLNLPRTLTGTDRPALFGAYLRQDGGVTWQGIKDCEDDARQRAAAGEVKLNECGPCSTAQKEENLRTLRRLRDQMIEACASIGR
jgi:hypothetical protein